MVFPASESTVGRCRWDVWLCGLGKPTLIPWMSQVGVPTHSSFAFSGRYLGFLIRAGLSTEDPCVVHVSCIWNVLFFSHRHCQQNPSRPEMVASVNTWLNNAWGQYWGSSKMWLFISCSRKPYGITRISPHLMICNRKQLLVKSVQWSLFQACSITLLLLLVE